MIKHTQQTPSKDAGKTAVSTTRRIEKALLEEISIGELAPGMRLDEVSLANRYKASRTPVREALNRLTAQGILVRGEKRGVFVAEYSKKELSQIFEAMHEIEAACARIVATRLTLLSRSEIETAQEECVKAAESGDIPAYLRANESFHLAIYKATQNPYMAELAYEFRHRTASFRAKKFRTTADLLASARAHQALIKDILSEDSNIASLSMRTHMTSSFLDMLKAN